MYVLLKFLDNPESVRLDGVTVDMTVIELKELIEEQEGIPVDRMALICRGRDLARQLALLKDYNIGEGSTIFVVYRMR